MSLVDSLNEEGRKHLIEKNLIAFEAQLKQLAPLIRDETISVDEVVDRWATIFKELPELKGLVRQLCARI